MGSTPSLRALSVVPLDSPLLILLLFLKVLPLLILLHLLLPLVALLSQSEREFPYSTLGSS